MAAETRRHGSSASLGEKVCEMAAIVPPRARQTVAGIFVQQFTKYRAVVEV